MPPAQVSPSAEAPAHEPRLTELVGGAGCGCKLPADALLALLPGISAEPDPRVLVGNATSDDAAVLLLADGLAIVQTIDFFTPPVDDPYDFGRIAAANALSDVYAMGGTPISALNVVAFPLERLGGEVLEAIVRGGLDVARTAGVSIVGGHSIDDSEPKYGLAVTGTVDPQRIVRNSGARPGDVLVLTKPLGTGAIIAARRRGNAGDDMLRRAVETMVELNAPAAERALAAGVHAMTDVTGFGLLGHLHHVCRESGVAAVLDSAAVPVLPGVQELLGDESGVSGGTRRNAAWAASFTRHERQVAPWRRLLLADATTSGGLLAALPAAVAGDPPGPVIGRLVDGPAGTISVV